MTISERGGATQPTILRNPTLRPVNRVNGSQRDHLDQGIASIVYYNIYNRIYNSISPRHITC